MPLSPFFTLAARSPGRQHSFRTLVAVHVLLLTALVFALHLTSQRAGPVLFGQILLVAGIVEGGLLVGWRLTQLPKSQALEFLLVSQLRPALVFLGEAVVGLSRLALVTLAGLPLLVLLACEGTLLWDDVPALLVFPWIWGAVTGLALTQYAYESPVLRRWCERVLAVLIVFYLLVGVLAGEHLPNWLGVLPPALARTCLDLFRGFHEYNPFGVLRYALEQPPESAWPRLLWIGGLGLVLVLALLCRAAARLHGHFHDEHYRPVRADHKEKRAPVGDRPLTWWAVKRVTRFSGRINLWLAGGFTVVYAVFILFESAWPTWLGTQVFHMFERLGGLPVIITALVLLAAVPAAFQYGLWDSNVPDRCRRLELLLLTRLDGAAYWHASARAAWNRGRGYFALALLLWWAGLLAGRFTLAQALASLGAALTLWGLYFALGFRAFARGLQANVLGMVLTLGLPLAVSWGHGAGHPYLAALLPPGSVYYALRSDFSWPLLTGALVWGVLALGFARQSLAECERELRRWYDANHGAKAAR